MTMTTQSEQIIYYDPDDEASDGNGWNIVEPYGAVALRYPTRADCIAWCESEGMLWRDRRPGEQVPV